MSQQPAQGGTRTEKLRNIDARKRWELFHQAIAHAKRSNVAALQEEQPRNSRPRRARPLLSIAR